MMPDLPGLVLENLCSDELTGAVEKRGPQAEGHEGTGVNMDVNNFSRYTMILISLFIFAGCSENKTTEEVFPNKNQDIPCQSEALVKNKFIVTFEDGRMEVVEFENAAVFEKHYLKPKLNEIKHVEYDRIIRLSEPEKFNEHLPLSDVDGTWGPDDISAKSAWDQNVKGLGVKVAVVDAAVDYSHPQIAARLSPNLDEINGAEGVDNDKNGYINDKYGWDFFKNQPQPDPFVAAAEGNENIHGTHVAGIILADPALGNVQGIAPQAELIPVNFMNITGDGTLGAAILGIRYASSRGAKIINASWGAPGCSDSLRQTILDVSTHGNEGNGILFVAAAGNDGVDFDRSPARFLTYPAAFNLPNQITVAANDISDLMTGFSNRSYNLIHLSAPGLGIKSTIPTFFAASGEKNLSGTSMAAPFVSGAAALLWSAKPNATAAQIKQALMSTVDPKSMKVISRGRLNVQKALEEIRRIAP